MRIVHAIPGVNWGGLGHRALETAQSQLAHGHDVLVLATPGGESFRRGVDLGLDTRPVNFGSGVGPALIGTLRKCTVERRGEVIDAHCNRDSAVAGFCRDLSAVVRTRHTKNRHPKRSWWRRLRWRASYDHVVACAQSVCNELIGEGAVPPDGVTAIGEWADRPASGGCREGRGASQRDSPDTPSLYHPAALCRRVPQSPRPSRTQALEAGMPDGALAPLAGGPHAPAALPHRRGGAARMPGGDRAGDGRSPPAGPDPALP